jgi:hypothetical protein
MADGITMTVSGIGDILGGLDRGGSMVRTAAQMRMYDTVRATFDESQALCPVDTGAMKASGTMEVGDLTGSVTYWIYYSIFLEMGHHDRGGGWVPAQPFLTPAFENASAHYGDGLQGMFG